MPSCDVIVIGAGPNGLAAAGRLAQSGRRVVVVDRLGVAGGGAAALPHGDLPPMPLAHLAFRFDPRVEQGLNLPAHGLHWADRAVATTALSATGDHVRLDGAFGETLTGAPDDRAVFAALRAQLVAMARVMAPLRERPAPRLSRKGNDWLALARIGLRARLQGRDAVREMLRMLLTNVWDVTQDELTHPLLQGLLVFDATLGSWLGPRSPNSLIGLVDRLAAGGALARPQGGMGALAQAMAQAATAAGATLRLGAGVAAIRTDGETVHGVTLSDGEMLDAPVIVSAIAPQTTLLSLVGPRWLDAGLVTALRHRKARGAAAKLHLLLDKAPDFRGADPTSRLVIAPDADTVERAFNPVKYGDTPAAPVMEIVLQGTTLSAIVQYAPHDPKDPVAASAALLAATLETLETHSPGLRASIRATDFLMPQDIAPRWGMPGGQWHHLEHSVEQMLFLRPLPQIAQYRTPINGLWLASAGTHPGGGVTGTNGWNAAGEVLR